MLLKNSFFRERGKYEKLLLVEVSLHFLISRYVLQILLHILNHQLSQCMENMVFGSYKNIFTGKLFGKNVTNIFNVYYFKFYAWVWKLT